MKHITLKEWKQLADTVSNSRLSEKIYPEFKAYYIEDMSTMNNAADAAFRQLGYKLQQRVKCFETEMKQNQEMIDTLK